MAITPNRMPSLRPMAQRPPQDVLRIAHRGADGAERYDAESLSKIAKQGAHLVEFDLHVTGDDRLVARHDPTVMVEGRRRWLVDYPLADHREILSRMGVLTAEDVVCAAKEADLGLYIDLKSLSRRAAQRLLEILRIEGMADRAILSSPRSDLIALCAEVAPGVPRAVLFSSTMEEPIQLAAAVSADFVHPCWEAAHPRPDQMLADGWLERIRSHGLGVICWHEERPDVLGGLYDLGVDGICTDTPDVLTGISLRQETTAG